MAPNSVRGSAAFILASLEVERLEAAPNTPLESPKPMGKERVDGSGV